ncbi:MAG: glycosyltransferase [Spirochaetia bacterium]|nr:glycosyltransferase [Spirochaetales bacterium]MBR5927462.1 glycosyltransferase [Spirochaetia bacterium]
MATVSVIMACHNGAPFLCQAVDSVLAQTYQDWELLIIDDASTDGSVAIAEEYCAKDDRIKLLHTERSTGMPATTRNVGIEAAAGRFIAFLDCDDQWLPGKLEHQLPLFKQENCAAVFSFYKKMNASGNIRSAVVTSLASVDFDQLLDGNCIGNLTGIYDTAKVGKVFQKEIHHEDYLMWLQVLKKGFIARNTGTVEAYYRESCSSVSGSKLKALGWTWDIYRKELGLPLGASALHFIRYGVKGLLKKIK